MLAGKRKTLFLSTSCSSCWCLHHQLTVLDSTIHTSFPPFLLSSFLLSPFLLLDQHVELFWTFPSLTGCLILPLTSDPGAANSFVHHTQKLKSESDD